jgi:hypothetical protein
MGEGGGKYQYPRGDEKRDFIRKVL